MAKNKLEEKVEKLASSEVDTFIRHNENKQTTGRNVRPVIESWADELDNIASSTDREEASPEDFQRINKAINTLRNILKSKDDELTYFMVNAPKKFWDTLRYVFDDTFKQRNYDPQPLTKYEIPGYAPQRMGLKPSPKKEKPGSNIPDEPKLNLTRLPKDNGPRFDREEYMQSRTAQEQLRKQKEAEEKELKEKEEREKQELEDKKIEERLEQEKRDNPMGFAVNIPKEKLDKYINGQVEVERGQSAQPRQHQFTRPGHTQIDSNVNNDSSSQGKNSSNSLAGLWEQVAIISGKILEKELKMIKGLNSNSIENIPAIAVYCETIIDKLSQNQPVDGISLKEAVGAQFALLTSPPSREIIKDLIPQGARDLYTRDMILDVANINKAYRYILELNFDNITARDIFGIKVLLLENAQVIVENAKSLVKADLAEKQYTANRIETLQRIKAQYLEAYKTEDDSRVTSKVTDLFHKNSKESFTDDAVETIILKYLDDTVKTKAYNKTKLLVNAIKRLNGYVREN